MNEERRRSPRIAIPLTLKWRGANGTVSEGTLGDISLTGSYILTSGKIQANEEIRLQLDLPDKSNLSLQGKAVYQVADLGFAVCFDGLTRCQSQALQHLLNQHSGGEL